MTMTCVVGTRSTAPTSHNRGGLTTTRHDAVQWALRTIARAVGRVVHVVGHQAWFTGGALVAAGLDPLREALYADLVIPHYRAPGRHLFIDVAVGIPALAGEFLRPVEKSSAYW